MFVEKLVDTDIERIINDLKSIENLEPGKESCGLIFLYKLQR